MTQQTGSPRPEGGEVAAAREYAKAAAEVARWQDDPAYQAEVKAVQEDMDGTSTW